VIDTEDAAELAYVTHDEIARLAYLHWEARGRPEGSPEVDWLRAEQELLEQQRESREYKPESITISDTRID
jgi:hypothetical protein